MWKKDAQTWHHSAFGDGKLTFSTARYARCHVPQSNRSGGDETKIERVKEGPSGGKIERVKKWPEDDFENNFQSLSYHSS